MSNDEDLEYYEQDLLQEAFKKYGTCGDCGYPADHDHLIIGLIRNGSTERDEEGSFYNWLLLDRKEIEAKFGPITKETDIEYLIQDICGWYRSYNGAGRFFWAEPSMKVGRYKLLIKQFGAYDI